MSKSGGIGAQRSAGQGLASSFSVGRDQVGADRNADRDEPAVAPADGRAAAATPRYQNDGRQDEGRQDEGHLGDGRLGAGLGQVSREARTLEYISDLLTELERLAAQIGMPELQARLRAAQHATRRG